MTIPTIIAISLYFLASSLLVVDPSIETAVNALVSIVKPPKLDPVAKDVWSEEIKEDCWAVLSTLMVVSNKMELDFKESIEIWFLSFPANSQRASSIATYCSVVNAVKLPARTRPSLMLLLLTQFHPFLV